MTTLSPAEQDLILEGFRDHQTFCRESLSIRDKRGIKVPLELSPSQLKLYKAAEKQRAAGKPVRVVSLKARQVHMSVGAASIIFKQVAFLPGQQAIVFADKHKTNQNLFGYYDHFREEYQPFRGIKQLPFKRRVMNQRLEWKGRSLIEFGSAENAKGGHSFSWRHIHLSEFAFWRDASKLMTRLLPSVPQDPFTTIIVESTANGLGGPFYDLCERAQNPTESSEWAFVFFAWWEHPEYNRPVEDIVRLQRTYTDDELAMIQKYQLKPQQIAWRRWAIANICEGSETRFQQEFPSNPEEAFLTSGRPYFDHKALSKMPLIREPITGELSLERIGMRELPRFNARDDGKGMLRIWKKPEAGKLYALGADTALGRDVNDGGGSADPDYSVGQVLDIDTGEQVAVLRGRLEPSPFGEYLSVLGRWYNDAYLIPELNFGSGIATIEELLRQQYPLEMIYQRRRRPDDRRTPTLQELGWETTTVTRPQLLQGLYRATREMSVIIRDPVTLQELRTFVYTATGKPQGEQGKHDDCVIALALAVVGIGSMPRVRRQQQMETSGAAVRYGAQPKEDDDRVRWRR